jgi:hypothetical protein
MIGSLGGFFAHLPRLAVGPLVLPLDSTPGSIREVTPAELAALEALLPADRSGSVAVSLCTIVHALYTRFTKRFSTSISEIEVPYRQVGRQPGRRAARRISETRRWQ